MNSIGCLVPEVFNFTCNSIFCNIWKVTQPISIFLFQNNHLNVFYVNQSKYVYASLLSFRDIAIFIFFTENPCKHSNFRKKNRDINVLPFKTFHVIPTKNEKIPFGILVPMKMVEMEEKE